MGNFKACPKLRSVLHSMLFYCATLVLLGVIAGPFFERIENFYRLWNAVDGENRQVIGTIAAAIIAFWGVAWHGIATGKLF